MSRLGHVDDKVTQEQFEAPEEDTPRTPEEETKLQENDVNECQTLFKKVGSKLYVYGKTFENLDTLEARFKLNDQIVPCKAYYKSKGVLAVTVPELFEA